MKTFIIRITYILKGKKPVPLQKKTRKKVYQLAYKLYVRFKHYGICRSIDHALETLGLDEHYDDKHNLPLPGSPYDTDTLHIYWPEFHSFRPSNASKKGYWFPIDERVIREEIFERLIKGKKKRKNG